MVLIKIVTEAIKAYGPRIARGLAHYERPLFRSAYNSPRLWRMGKPIYRGYRAGTIIGLAGDAILDALLSESDVNETPSSQERKTRDYMVKSRTKRKYSEKCPPYRRNRGRT